MGAAGYPALVDWFAAAMLKKLNANRPKGGWDATPNGALFARLKEETAELSAAVSAGKSVAEVLGEAADVANFALFIADNYAAANTEGSAASPAAGARPEHDAV